MKNTAIILLFAISSHFLAAQNFCTTGGSQGGSLGVPDCCSYTTPCSEESDAQILLFLETDLYAGETSWKMLDMTNAITIAEGDSLVNDTTYQHFICAQKDHCYHFTITDSAGNGIDQARGIYYLYWNGDLVKSGTNFGAIDSISFGACCTNFSVELTGGIPCINYTDGQVLLETHGGTPPFDYLWSNGDTFTELQYVSANDEQISVTVSDASNCLARDTFQITNLQPLEFVVETTTGVFCDPNSGMASVSIQSGIPPFTYAWSTGGYQQSEQNLAPGTYSVTVTDASHCFLISNFTVNESSPIIMKVDTVYCETNNNEDGAINITISGGTGPNYYFEWYYNFTLISVEEDPSGLSAGQYTVIVTDSYGCSDIFIIDVDQISNINVQNLENYITLIPNPTIGKAVLMLNFQQYHKVQIVIYNKLGKAILTKPPRKIQTDLYEFDLSNYSSGIYLIKISVDGRTVTKRLVLSK